MIDPNVDSRPNRGLPGTGLPPVTWLRFGLLTVLFLLVSSLALAKWKTTWNHPFRKISLEGDWIQSPEASASAYFRKRFDLTGTVRHAWVVVAANNGFELSVNRNPVSRQYLWRPTRPFQTGASEKGQRVVPDDSAMALNFPREYQWSGHQNACLPTLIDISHELKVGKNVICLEAESRQAPASVNFFGEITLWNGRVIPIRSDLSWKSEPVPLGLQKVDWTDKRYWDKSWRNATPANVSQVEAYRTAPLDVFQKPFTGEWMRGPSSDDSNRIQFVAKWNLEDEVDEAWLRIITNRRYELFINDHPVSVSSSRPPDVDLGEWMVGRDAALDPISKPELLDPDEVGAFFGGKKFEMPRDAQPNLEEFIRLKPKTHLPFRNYKTTNRAENGGVFEPTRTLSQSRRTPAKPDLPAEQPKPNSLKRDQAIAGYLAYSVGKMLRRGPNKIEVRCVPEPGFQWPTKIAVDGSAAMLSGQSMPLPDLGWQVKSGSAEWQSVIKSGPVHWSGQHLPRLQYRGIAKDSSGMAARFLESLGQLAWAAMLLPLLVFGECLCQRWLTKNDAGGKSWGNGTLTTFSVMILVATSGLICSLLIEMSFAERDESLWFRQGIGWQICFAVTATLAIIVGLINIVGQLGLERLRQRGHFVSSWVKDLPNTKAWPHLLFWVILLAVFLRGYKLDVQPLDDDEYASTQAVLAILETGMPGFEAEDVYYTRSPLFHYATAAIAFPFGGNLWSLRLQSVFWSIATMVLAYLCGSQLLKSKWIGFAAMVLLAVHPFEVFTGHVIRFYQLQQFFALLTIYLFCRGFVIEQQQSYRIATIVVFLAAVLSQEISAVMGVPLLLGYFLFAKDLGWRCNIQLIIISVAVVILIGVDLIAFKTLCLTRTEGVSPSIEASVKPHFWYPLNLFSIFIGYSRLHVIPSFFFFVGLPLLWREKNLNAIALVMFLLSGVLMTNLLVSHVSLRYQYWLFPVWVLVSLHSIGLGVRSLVELIYRRDENLNRYVTTTAVCSALVFSAILISWSPWRMVESYETKMLGDSTGCVRWVRSQMRPGDKLAVTEPHTHAGFLEAGKVDFDLAVPLLYDFAVVQDGRLVDRNGGGELVSNLDSLIRLFEKEDRVWVLLNREKFRTRGKNMRWEYPGARLEQFLRQNCELKHRTYLWHAYLWDSRNGHFLNFRKQQ